MPISDAKKFYIYNRALLELESRQLSSLTENRKPRRVLDAIWGDNDDIVLRALSSAGWNFAMRTSALVLNDALETNFGWRYAFQKPTDFVRLEAFSPNESFQPSLDAEYYADEAGFWLSNYENLYVKYVSSGESFGFDSSKWTPDFDQFLFTELAYEGASPITHNASKKRDMMDMMEKARAKAKSRDSMDEGSKRIPSGDWTQSRRSGTNRDRVRGGNLIG